MKTTLHPALTKAKIPDIMQELETLRGFQFWLEKLAITPSINSGSSNPLIRYIKCRFFLYNYTDSLPFVLGSTEITFMTDSLIRIDTPLITRAFLLKFYDFRDDFSDFPATHIGVADTLKIMIEARTEVDMINLQTDEEF